MSSLLLNGRLIIPAKVRRSETLVKGYNGTVQVCFYPTPEFDNLPSDIKQEIIDQIRGLTFLNFRVNSDSGDVSIGSSYLSRFFTIETVDEGDWEYDDGEVTTLGVNYDSDLRLI